MKDQAFLDIETRECEICEKAVEKRYRAAAPDGMAWLCRDCMIRWLTGRETDEVEPVLCLFCKQPTTATFNWKDGNAVYQMCPACLMEGKGRTDTKNPAK